MYRGPPSGRFMFCGDRNRTLCSTSGPGKVVVLLKRHGTIVESNQLKQLASYGAHTNPAARRNHANIPHPFVRDWAESRVRPLTQRPARRDQGREAWEPYVPAEKSSHGSSRDGRPRHTQLPTSHNAFYIPFRRKKNSRMEIVSWADDEYWSHWDSWDEVIDWGDEKVTDKTAKGPTRFRSTRPSVKGSQRKSVYMTHNAFYMEPGLMRDWSSGVGEGTRAAVRTARGSDRGQRKSRVLDSTETAGSTGNTHMRWYSSTPMPNGDVIPFRRKKNSRMEVVSWADDEYWSHWDSWDEVIDWGDEKVTDKTAKGPTRGRSPTRGHSTRLSVKGSQRKSVYMT